MRRGHGIFALDEEGEVLISCRSLKPAIHLYQKFGFREVLYRKEFWKSEKADIEMERKKQLYSETDVLK